MKELLRWEADNSKIIEMTVGLPALNALQIIWLPLESLKRQINITFGWELLIMEEEGESLPLIEQFISKNKGRNGNKKCIFPGCQRIVYLMVEPLIDGRRKGKFEGKYLLIDKWLHMANISDQKSKIFVFQDADDYSPTARLSIHYQHFKNSKCLYSTQERGLFVYLPTGEKVFYYGERKDNKQSSFLTVNHLNKAVRVKDLRKIRKIDKNRRIDTYIRSQIEKKSGINFRKKKCIFKDREIDSENWKTGFFTDGQNNISHKRKDHYITPKGVFVEFNQGCLHNKYIGFEHYLPSEVINFISQFKSSMV